MFECYRNMCQKCYYYLNTENCYLNISTRQPHIYGLIHHSREKKKNHMD